MNTDKAKARLEELIAEPPTSTTIDEIVVVLTEVLDTVEILQRRMDEQEAQITTIAHQLLQVVQGMNKSADIQIAMADRLLIVEAARKACQ